jgi:hypothetical protein
LNAPLNPIGIIYDSTYLLIDLYQGDQHGLAGAHEFLGPLSATTTDLFATLQADVKDKLKYYAELLGKPVAEIERMVGLDKAMSLSACLQVDADHAKEESQRARLAVNHEIGADMAEKQNAPAQVAPPTDFAEDLQERVRQCQSHMQADSQLSQQRRAEVATLASEADTQPGCTLGAADTWASSLDRDGDKRPAGSVASEDAPEHPQKKARLDGAAADPADSPPKRPINIYRGNDEANFRDFDMETAQALVAKPAANKGGMSVNNVADTTGTSHAAAAAGAISVPAPSPPAPVAAVSAPISGVPLGQGTPQLPPVGQYEMDATGKLLAQGAMTSTLSKKDWDSFDGKLKSKAFPVELTTLRHGDKKNLFNLWLECDKSFPKVLNLIHTVKLESERCAKTLSESFKKRDLDLKYAPDKVTFLISHCKKLGTWRPDPYFPKDETENYYMIFSKATMENSKRLVTATTVP